MHASAEATGLEPGAFELAVLADALHWVDPEPAGREIARVVAPNGILAVVDIELEPTPFVDAVVAAAREANPKAFPRKRETPAARLAHLVAAAGAGRVRRETFADARPIADADLPGLLASLSFVGPALGAEGFDRLLATARDAAAASGGAVWARRLGVAYARLG